MVGIVSRQGDNTMAYYYLNKNAQANGDHEVHTGSCSWLPDIDNREYLGSYASSYSAIIRARALHPYWHIDGCAHCCPESHKS
jgi:hypothetical protein